MSLESQFPRFYKKQEKTSVIIPSVKLYCDIFSRMLSPRPIGHSEHSDTLTACQIMFTTGLTLIPYRARFRIARWSHYSLVVITSV